MVIVKSFRIYIKEEWIYQILVILYLLDYLEVIDKLIWWDLQISHLISL
jgi:hypothetical protein